MTNKKWRDNRGREDVRYDFRHLQWFRMWWNLRVSLLSCINAQYVLYTHWNWTLNMLSLSHKTSFGSKVWSFMHRGKWFNCAKLLFFIYKEIIYSSFVPNLFDFPFSMKHKIRHSERCTGHYCLCNYNELGLECSSFKKDTIKVL